MSTYSKNSNYRGLSFQYSLCHFAHTVQSESGHFLCILIIGKKMNCIVAKVLRKAFFGDEQNINAVNNICCLAQDHL